MIDVADDDAGAVDGSGAGTGDISGIGNVAGTGVGDIDFSDILFRYQHPLKDGSPGSWQYSYGSRFTLNY